MNNKEETKLAHNAIAEKYFELYKDDTTDLEYFDKFLSDCGDKILDLGCGMGHYSNYMAQKGFKVTGVDFSSKMIEIAKANFKNIDSIEKKQKISLIIPKKVTQTFLAENQHVEKK